MARPHPALLDLAAGRRLPGIKDFDEFLRSAYEHRMHGILWDRVSRGEIAGPPSWEQRLAMLSLRDDARHRRLWRVIGHLVEVSGSLGARLATFKGVAAEARWYDRLGERPCYDVDVLLDPASLDRVDELVEALVGDHPGLGSLSECVRRGSLQYLELIVEGERVDLHFDPLKMGIPCRQRETVWARLVDVEGPEGVSVRSYDAETSLVYFLLHLNRDRFRYLLGLVDVHRLLERTSIDEEFFNRFVESEGIGGPVRQSLSAALGALDDERAGADRVRGVRTIIWHLLWGDRVRLLGDQSLGRYWWRSQFILPFLYQGRSIDAMQMLLTRWGRSSACRW